MKQRRARYFCHAPEVDSGGVVSTRSDGRQGSLLCLDRGRNDPVATGILGEIEGLIGPLQQG